MTMLTMEKVKYKYRNSSSYAVKNADCAFEPGKLYAIIGPSGSGKSTLLSMLAGLDLPTEGEVMYGEKSLKNMDLDRYRREDVSMIFQAFQLFPLLTVIENVCYPMELRGVSTKQAKVKAEEYLHKVGITKEQMKRFPANLSGGEQQRIAIARSLLNKPKVIIADEPTGNLDPETAENIVLLLKGITHSGTAVVMSTHNLPMLDKVPGVVYRCESNTLEEVKA